MASQTGILGLVNDAHPAAPQFTNDYVGADDLTDHAIGTFEMAEARCHQDQFGEVRFLRSGKRPWAGCGPHAAVGDYAISQGLASFSLKSRQSLSRARTPRVTQIASVADWPQVTARLSGQPPPGWDLQCNPRRGWALPGLLC